MRVLQSMQNPRHFGPITAMCVDRKRCWFIVGTSTGVLSLWDRRFGLLLKSWRAGNVGEARCRIQQCVIHPSKGRGKWIIVALEVERAEDDDEKDDHPPQILLEVWDVENTILVETFATRSTTNVGAVTVEKPPTRINVDAETNPAAAIAAFVKDSQSSPKSPKDLGSVDTPFTDNTPKVSRTIRTIQVGLDFGGHSSMPKSDLGIVDISTSSRTAGRGFILSGSDDRKIRLWDLGRVERSVVLAGLNPETERATFRFVPSLALPKIYID
jgi:phosphoinositide-3-kinase, regulatory subunit 4